MELRHLRYFVAVAEEMNFHRAAERLRISQPPLSMQIMQLEQEIGTPLFTRDKRSILLTPAGEIFLRHSRKILKESLAAVEDARSAGAGLRGKIRISFVSSAVTGFLQKSISKFSQIYPGVTFELMQSVSLKIAEDVQRNEIDIGIARFPIDLSGYNVREFPQEKEPYCLAVYTGHRLEKKNFARIEDLRNENIIMFPRETAPASHDDVMSIFFEKNITPRIVQEATEQFTISGLVASRLGVAIVPACMKNVTVSGIRHIALKNIRQKTGFTLITRPKPGILERNFLNVVNGKKIL